MLGNYKKIATGTYNLNFSIHASNTNKLDLIQSGNWNYYKLKSGIKIPLKLDFNPSLFYITIPKIYLSNRELKERYIILNNKAHYQTMLEGEHNIGLPDKFHEGVGYIESISKDEVIININIADVKMDGEYPFRMAGNCEWIAIE